MTKKKVWLSYAWKDNQEQDVDFVVQELEARGLEVKIDRTTIGAGRRLWEQIESFITSPDECDAWLWFATQNSLNSEPCKEELAFALDRALQSRGAAFPMIALLQRDSSIQLLPASVRTRLCVSLSDPHWLERVASAAEGRPPELKNNAIPPFSLRVIPFNGRKAIEVRPRTGYWSPFLFAVPAAEVELYRQSTVCIGPRGMPNDFMFIGSTDNISPDGQWIASFVTQEVTSGTCGFFICDRIPSRIQFGTPERWYIVEQRNIPTIYSTTGEV